MADHDGFLSRWSRRKASAKQGVEVPEQVSAATQPVRAEFVEASVQVRSEPTSQHSPSTGPERTVLGQSGGAADTPPPTLDDVAALTKDSDFSRFVAPNVDPSVKNAALKKLFASEPQFNVMDGLDVYIDDYNKFEPIPKAALRQLVTARMLGLIDDELEAQPQPDSHPPNAAHENADLQLQSHDAAGCDSAGPSLAAGRDSGDPLRDPVPPPSA